MPLTEIPLPAPTAPLPDAASSYIAEAERRIDQLFETEQNRRTPKFFPSDPALFYHALDHLTQKGLPLGRTFCEWGSGLGVATCLASLLGYEAYGIELESSLIDIARDLSDHLGIPATFIETNYIPEALGTYEAIGGTELITPSGAALEDALEYDGIPHTADEIDVYFIYPWPGEQELFQKLFDLIAADGAILIVYYGDLEIAAYLKTPAGDEDDGEDEDGDGDGDFESGEADEDGDDDLDY